jgi:hypothetical protein
MQIRAQSGLRWAWAFAILWNLIAAPATLFGAAPAIRRGPGVAWVALVFPIAGAALLLWALQLTLRVRRFGNSLFDMAGESAAVGGPLRGTITAKNLPGDTTVRLTLTCINRVVTGSGDSRSASERIVWQDEQTVPPHALLAGPDGPVVPVAFVLPNGAPPTRETNPNDRIVWRLHASAVLPGVDYGGQFEVPVGGGGTGPKAGAGGHDALSIPVPAGAQARPEASCVVVEPLPEGGTCYLLPAGRHPGAAIGLGAFTLLFGSMPAAILFFMAPRTGASIFGLIPFLFAAVFLGFALLLAFLTLYIAFLSTRVTAAPGRLSITCRLLGLSWTRTLASSDVRELRLKVGMQAGTTPYYDLLVELASGGRATVSAFLRDRREAEWLAGAIRCSLSR